MVAFLLMGVLLWLKIDPRMQIVSALPVEPELVATPA